MAVEENESVGKRPPSGDAAPRRLPRRATASELLYESLRERIVSLELEPGAPLPRQELAAEYGVSQTPIRDATLKLAREGLVSIYPQSRTVVAIIDVDHARETQFLRLALELEVTRRLAQAPDPKALIAPARRILRQQKAALELDGDLQRFAQLDKAFHESLCEAVGHRDLWRLISERSGHIDRLRALNLPDPGKPKAILEFHERILDAIAARNLDDLDAAVRGHLSGTLAAADAIRARRPEFF